jgi:hypothetical protein
MEAAEPPVTIQVYLALALPLPAINASAPPAGRGLRS